MTSVHLGQRRRHAAAGGTLLDTLTPNAEQKYRVRAVTKLQKRQGRF
jgi:hypothetical protein